MKIRINKQELASNRRKVELYNNLIIVAYLGAIVIVGNLTLFLILHMFAKLTATN